MRTPKYRKHAGRDRAFVEHRGQRHYLPGPFNSAESVDAYKAFLREQVFADTPTPKPPASPLIILGLVASYLEFARRHYPPGNRSEFSNVKVATMNLAGQFGEVPVAKFGPKLLKEFQQALVAAGGSRKYINGQVSRVKRMFRWAASEELAPASIHHALAAVDGLRVGRTDAVELAPRKPVALADVEATLPHLSATVAGMVRFQWLTGARSDSVCHATAAQFDRTGDVWLWRPKHKQQFAGRVLVVPIGPQAQAILKPFLNAAAAPEAFLFSPRSIRKNNRYRQRYGAGSYCVAVKRGIARANKAGEKIIHDWTPHQIRHARATIVREAYGLEAAQAALGHESLDATQIYAQRLLDKAKVIAREIG